MNGIRSCIAHCLWGWIFFFLVFICYCAQLSWAFKLIYYIFSFPLFNRLLLLLLFFYFYSFSCLVRWTLTCCSTQLFLSSICHLNHMRLNVLCALTMTKTLGKNVSQFETIIWMNRKQKDFFRKRQQQQQMKKQTIY